MAFSAVFQFRAGDEGGKNRFLLEHYLEHRVFTATLLAGSPPFAPVDLPIQRMDDEDRWLAAHQQMSQSVWTALGGGQMIDLERLNWKDEGQVQDWFNLHALWHRAVREALSL